MKVSLLSRFLQKGQNGISTTRQLASRHTKPGVSETPSACKTRSPKLLESDVNIYVFGNKPIEIVKVLDDNFLKKVVFELAQILCQVQRRYSFSHPFFHKAVERDHPCVLWAGMTDANYSWTYEYFLQASREYSYRFGKIHRSWLLLGMLLRNLPKGILEAGISPFVQAVPEQYKTGDARISYLHYYKAEKISIFSKWTNRPVPEFVFQG